MLASALSGPELYGAISGVGNNEMKSLVFGLIQDGVAYTASPLHTKIIAVQGDKPAWPVSVGTPFSYCDTFETVGVAAKSTTEPLAYTINELGRKLVIPLVGHLLDVSLQEEQALADFHGPTSTNAESGIRPSQRRIEIMREVRNTEGRKISTAELAFKIGTRIGYAGSVAEDLAAHGIIERASSGRGKATVTYSPESTLADITLRSDVGSKLLFDVVSVLQNHFKSSGDAISNKQIANTLINDHGYQQDSVSLTRQVAAKTNMLADKRKALKPHRSQSGENVREAIWASEEQLATINNLLEAIDGIQNPSREYLHEGHDKLEVILNNPDLVNHLAAKALAASTGLKRFPEAQLANMKSTKSVLVDSPKELTIREIQTLLVVKGVSLDRLTIRNYLNRFAECGEISIIRSEEGAKFSLIPE